MKRSEANLVQKARDEFSAEYSCLSIKPDDETGEDTEEYFTWHGCDICCQPNEFHGRLGGSVFDVNYRANADIEQRDFSAGSIHDGRLCGSCLCALVNGDDSDLDYSVDTEDTAKV